MAMKPEYRSWRARVRSLPEAEAEFERKLFVSIAGVLLGEKVGELIMLRADGSELDLEERLQRLARLSRSWRFWCRLLFRSSSCLRVIVYDRVRAQQRLARVPPGILVRMGYRPGIGHGEFLSEIGRRWRASGRVPHEVGLVLSYPLKDVLGFMGLYPLRYAGGCGWRIYGNPSRSLRRSQRFKQARERAIAFLEP